MTQGKRHLERVHGGRRHADRDEGRAFCEHIGWQALHEPWLPDDYEDQLVARIFAGDGGKVVPLRGAAAPESRRQLRWLALAIVAGVGAALFAWYRAEAPPTADTIP